MTHTPALSLQLDISMSAVVHAFHEIFRMERIPLPFATDYNWKDVQFTDVDYININKMCHATDNK